MDLLAHGLDRATISIVCEDNRIPKIWVLIGLLSIDTNEIQMLPNLLKQPIKIELHVATNHNSVGLLCDHVDFLHRNGVDLVVTIQALDVFSIS